MRNLTKRLYWHDTYQFKLVTKVLEKGLDEKFGHWILTNETIFHPQGGGQPSDEGTINGIPVLKVMDEKIDNVDITAKNYDLGRVLHYFSDDPKLSVGDTVTMEIDAAKRLEHSALHTAGHIIAGLLRTQYNYKKQPPANHFPGSSRVEFQKDGDDIEQNSIIRAVEDIIKNGRVVSADFQKVPEVHRDLERGEMGRCVTIDRLWTEPCSGTHLKITDEIDSFGLRSIKNKKGKVSVGYFSDSIFNKKNNKVLEENDHFDIKEGDIVKSFITPNNTKVDFIYKNKKITGELQHPSSEAQKIVAEDIHINLKNDPRKTVKLTTKKIDWQIQALKSITDVSLAFTGQIVITRLSDWSFGESNENAASIACKV